MKFRRTDNREQVKLQMTPMIDIVFQLMVFFVFTFKIALPEGDFNVRTPAASRTPDPPGDAPLLKVHLLADADRELSGVEVGGVQVAGEDPLLALQAQLRAKINDSARPGAALQEVEIEADHDLKYRYVVRAMSAITGYVDPVTGHRHKLIEKVRFAPLARPTTP